MKATVQTFKESGKLYDTFDVTLPDGLQAWDKPNISHYLIGSEGQCKRMNFIYIIDEIPQLVVHK